MTTRISKQEKEATTLVREIQYEARAKPLMLLGTGKRRVTLEVAQVYDGKRVRTMSGDVYMVRPASDKEKQRGISYVALR